MSCKEYWKDIPGYVGSYKASTLGRIKSLDRVVERSKGYWKLSGKILKGTKNKEGYIKYSLRKNKLEKKFGGHQLVAMAFLNHIPGDRRVIDHIDRDPSNNEVNNLREVTDRENSHNKDKSKTSSKFVGVYLNTAGKWTCNIKINLKNYNLCSRFKDEETAHKVFLKAVDNIQYFNGNIKEFRDLIGIDKVFIKPHFDKLKNKFVVGVTINKVKIFICRIEKEEDAIKCYMFAKENVHLFKGDKTEFRDFVKNNFKNE